jgi:CubicO group peptidase (beta-lactamase class C family)
MEGTPASVGLRPSGVSSALEAAAEIPRLMSLLVVKDGILVVEEYYRGNQRDSLNDLRSVTKSVVSTLTGLAIQEGYLSGIDQTLGELLPDAPFDNPEQEDIRVRDLLTMSGGFDWFEDGAIGYNDWILSEDRIAYLLSKPLMHPPGSTFNYNSAAVHLLGVILTEVTGMELPELADQLLFGPIGVTQSRWEPLGPHFNGGAGIDLRPRDLARLGQLFLQSGVSGNRPILSKAWIRGATTPAYDWRASFSPLSAISYGYLWWTNDDVLGDAFLAWGYGGQFLYVVPDLNLVVVATTEWRGVSSDEGSDAVEEAVLHVIVDHLIPAVR